VTGAIRFALNHIAAPRRGFAAFAGLSRELGITEVEIRNDLPGVALQDGTPAASVRAAAAAAGVTILTINALQRFNVWNDARAEEARALAAYAREAGARALVMCPLNDTADRRDEATRTADLRTALAALAPILAEYGIAGLVEPLGFEESSLRLKRTAIDAIDAVGHADTFSVLHDTFHHFLAGETEYFPARTGLVHISGVEDRTLPRDKIRDAHRVLVGHGDIMGNLPQMMALLRGGYSGPFSFEPFSEEVHASSDIASALSDSIAYVTTGLSR
jgi:2-keto-myo-inositol isomerase